MIRVSGEVLNTTWCGQTVRAVRVIWAGERTLARVDADGAVRVFDHVAKHYTLCHPMTSHQIKRVRTLVEGASQ